MVESGEDFTAFPSRNLALQIERKGWPFQKVIILKVRLKN
jgi:hypothetical protein